MEFTISNGDNLGFYFNNDVLPGVKRVIDKVREDVKSVLGIKPATFGVGGYADVLKVKTTAIYVTTLGLDNDSPLTQDEIDTLTSRREAYAFVLKKADSGKNVLVIAGSDKRGTIYGLFHLSELMGVSPWVNMADVKPAKKNELVITDGDCFISRQPSVKYRGLFINDEWPSFGNWTFQHYGGFTAEMYDNIFELILRLKGNYLWPAMWTSNFSLDGPGLLSAELADEYGIVMSNSHHEPCSRHSEEWDLVRGEDSIYGNAWNFDKNKEGLTNYWRDGLKRNAPFENIITVGMRGERDSEVLGRNATLKENIDYLKEVIETQRKLISEVYGDEAENVPLMLAIYKEVEKYYFGDKETEGLKEWDGLDGITLMLCEDNQGNMRRLPDDGESHKGGFGMYYHFDYHGDPVSYEWVNSTYIPKVCEQMSEAYDKGVRDIWIVNVGDLKPLEFPISYFFDLAYDYDKYSIHTKKPYQRFLQSWTKEQFGNFLPEEKLEEINELLDSYTYLSSIRKPECLYPTTLNYAAYGEAERIYTRVNQIKKMADDLELYVAREKHNEISSAIYELVVFPSRIIANHYEMMITAGFNKAFAEMGRPVANHYAEEIAKCVRIEKNLIKKYHEVENGKWDKIMLSQHVGFRYWNEEENQYPTRTFVWPADKHRMIVYVPATGKYSMGGDWTRKTLSLFEFIKPNVNSQSFVIENGGNVELEWKIEGLSKDWINIDVTSGSLPVSKHGEELDSMCTVTVSIDREALRKEAGEGQVGYLEGSFTVIAGNKKVNMQVLAAAYQQGFDALKHQVPVVPDEWLRYITTPVFPTPFEDVRTLPVIGDDIGLAIEADEFTGCNGDASREMTVIKPFGKYSCGVKALKNTIEYKNDVTYDVELFEEGDYTLTFVIAPSNPISSRNTLKLGVLWNGRDESIINTIDESFVGGDNSNYSWSQGIFDGEHRKSITVHGKKGINQIAVKFIDEGIALERILVKSAKTPWCKGFLGPEINTKD